MTGISGFPTKEDCMYTPCYCEENVWQLCNSLKHVRVDVFEHFYVVFSSNDSKTIPLWCQNVSRQKDRPVVWDYHVFAVYFNKTSKQCLVFDLDTTLQFPCSFRDYFESAIRDDSNFKNEYKRNFRVIPADEYLRTFSSDRLHMIDKNGDWLAEPPKWPPIFDNIYSNLHIFWTTNENLTAEHAQHFDCKSEILATAEFKLRFTV